MADITDNQMEILLKMLENNLELILDYMDEEAKTSKETELEQYITSSVSFIEREGITLNLEDISDCMLVSMYAAWLYDKRKDGVAIMPRMIRYNLNNRLLQEKVNQNV